MKKSLKQLVAGVLLGVMVCTGFTPASVNAAAKPAVKSVTATAYGTVCNGKTIYMVKGKKTTIGVSVNPAKAKKSVKLSSSKKKVVKVKGKKLTAKKVGTAKITVKVKGKNGKTKKVKFTVKVVKSASQIPSGAIGGTKKTSSGTNTKKSTNSEPAQQTTYTADELCELAKQYYYNQTGYMPGHVDVDHVDKVDGEEVVVIHLYDVIGGHTATSDWYTVNYYGVGTDFFGNSIDISQNQ